MEFRCDRRSFLNDSLAVGGAAAAVGWAPAVGRSSEDSGVTGLRGRAEHCIYIWLGGGASQIDTWDPKKITTDGRKDPGSAYPAIDTAIPGVQVCEHLARTAPLMDRVIPVRTVHHDVVDEHAAASYRMHTGRPISSTVVYPSLGSIASKLLGPASDLVPTYVVMGNPSPARDPGFLGAQHGYVYLTSTDQGPEGLSRPARVTDERHARRMRMLEQLRTRYAVETGDDGPIQDYIAAAEKGARLAGPEFMRVFDVAAEPDDLRAAYGDEFGQRCLLARRLVERGSRFVEVSFNLNFVNGTGWDTHNEGHENQHLLIQGLDRAFSALLADLEEKQLLDKTLVVVSTEFGRPAQFDARGGRGHHAQTFSVVLAGGGLKTGQAVGTTDELGMHTVDRPVSVPDLFATILAALGANSHEELYAGSRPVPVTDMGQPLRELFV